MGLARTPEVLVEVLLERERQEAKWGEQNHPDGTSSKRYADEAEGRKASCAAAAREGRLTYLHILQEEVCEAAAEEDPAALRTELIQVAAVAVAWIEAIDRRTPRILDAMTGQEVTAELAAAMMTAHLRDPRIDPQAGDVLVLPPIPGKHVVPIHVVHRRDDVVYLATPCQPITTIRLHWWQVNMVGAEVIEDPAIAWPLPSAPC